MRRAYRVSNLVWMSKSSVRINLPEKDGLPVEHHIFGLPDVAANIEPESGDQVNNDRRTQRNEGQINEIDPNPSGRNAHFLAQVGTDTK